MVRALSRLGKYKTLFTEAKFSFTTVAKQDSYGTSTTGFPKDAASFDVVEWNTSGTTYIEVEPRPIERVLEVLRSAAAAPGSDWPSYYAFHGQMLVFGPAPPTVRTMRGWYHRDARRDSATGTLIDDSAASDAFTNDWFGDGLDALWAKTLQIYHLSFEVDAERAAYYGSEFSEAIEALSKQFMKKTMSSFKTEQKGLGAW